MRKRSQTGLVLLLGVLASRAAFMAKGATDDALRLPLKRVQPFPVISIELGGRTADVGLDTGGEGTMQLSREMLAEAGAVEVATGTHGATNVYGESQPVRRFRIPEVRVGGRVFSNLIATESAAFKHAPNVPNVVGGIGQAFLHRFVVLLDYPSRAISLLPPDASDSEARVMGCSGSEATLEHTEMTDLAISSVKTDGATLRLLWDTGAAYSAIPTNSADAHRL